MYKRISKSVAFRKPLWKEGLNIAQKNCSQVIMLIWQNFHRCE